MSETPKCATCGHPRNHLAHTQPRFKHKFIPAAAPVSEAAPTPETPRDEWDCSIHGRRFKPCCGDSAPVPTTPLAPAGEPTADRLIEYLEATYREHEVSRDALDRIRALMSEAAALRARVASLATERDAALFVQRYGTPFDPTGAKTGVEIQSLRAALTALRDAVKEWTAAKDAIHAYPSKYSSSGNDAAEIDALFTVAEEAEAVVRALTADHEEGGTL